MSSRRKAKGMRLPSSDCATTRYVMAACELEDSSEEDVSEGESAI